MMTLSTILDNGHWTKGKAIQNEQQVNKKRENETNVIKILTGQIVFLSVSQGAFQILFCGFFPLREITSVESVFRKEEDGSTIQFRKKNR